MLTIYEVLHAVPAFLFAYGGFRAVFNHEIGLIATLVVAAVVLLGTWIFPPIVDKNINL